MLIFFMTEIFYRPANVSGVKTPPYIALLQPEFPGKMTANPKKLATVRRVFNTAHSNTYTFLHCQCQKGCQRRWPHMAKYTKPLEEAGKGFIALGNLGAGLLFFQSFWLTEKLSSLVASIAWLISFYAIGMALISRKTRRRKK
ncbi:MAG: hypothetical protein OXU83_04285 [Gammaproteobacteria bacterium]|nr:hypothetical protein [Gammaproteobacteria bacterium]